MTITPTILLKDEAFLVITKPAGMIVNNADTARAEYTLQQWIEDNYKLPKTSESDFAKRGGIVHRLDKDTSGALVVALTEEAFVALQAQFKEKTVEKIYTALCHGKIVEEGEINVPIGRLPWNRMRFGVIPQGRESFTKFKVRKFLTLVDGKRKESLSLVDIYPQTGRTHQIRVHFQYVGHPLFGDALYAGRKNIQFDRRFLQRHFLHASVLSFNHPINHERLTCKSPLTKELQDFLDTLQ